MKCVRVILLIWLVLSLCGCIKANPIVVTEYVEVKVPVIYTINKPDRPKFNKTKQSIPEYITEILTYTETLEMIIDEHNFRGLSTINQ